MQVQFTCVGKSFKFSSMIDDNDDGLKGWEKEWTSPTLGASDIRIFSPPCSNLYVRDEGSSHPTRPC